jgi:peptidyl-prolyl cis-trans isomerase D
MISWIQKYFQKHFRLVFGLILVAMAVPLVVIYSQSAGIGRASSRSNDRPFFGYNLGNEDVFNRSFADATRSSQFKGNYQNDGGQIQQYALSRLAGLALADQLHLPVPSE